MHAAVLAVLKSFIIVHAVPNLSSTAARSNVSTADRVAGARPLSSQSHRGSLHEVLSVDPPEPDARTEDLSSQHSWVTAEVSATGAILQKSSHSWAADATVQQDSGLLASLPEEDSDERMIRRDIATSSKAGVQAEDAKTLTDRAAQPEPLGWHAHSTTTTHEPRTAVTGNDNWGSWLVRRLNTDKVGNNIVSNENRFKGAEWLMLGISLCVVLCLCTQKEMARKELRKEEVNAQENRVRQAKRLLAEAEAHAQNAATVQGSS
mmetsp:Transcript_74622/g.139327  ORF Transcript_74622/g.139327 Transcript_74622/m.139327 type:complete len:263 (+) Transcript_74622:93-881(+)